METNQKSTQSRTTLQTSTRRPPTAASQKSAAHSAAAPRYDEASLQHRTNCCGPAGRKAGCVGAGRRCCTARPLVRRPKTTTQADGAPQQLIDHTRCDDWSSQRRQPARAPSLLLDPPHHIGSSPPPPELRHAYARQTQGARQKQATIPVGDTTT